MQSEDLKNHTKFIIDPSMCKWLVNTAVQFDPEDDLFFEKKLRPVIEKRKMSSPQRAVQAMRRFVLANFPDIITMEFHHMMIELTALELVANEKTVLDQLWVYAKNPKALAAFQRQVLRFPRRIRDNNRVIDQFIRVKLFKNSFNNLVWTKPKSEKKVKCCDLDNSVEFTVI